ncbi:MAG: trigger factor [Planctomycetota bacterium]|nr:trigger factor [Planctomycetota bacterium]MDW8372910.1 trigger factor [Planctomycetota bacterium]
MEIQVADTGPFGKCITVCFTQDEIAERRHHLLREIASGAELKGFRPGKAPRALLEKRYGAAVDAQLDRELREQALREALTRHRLVPFGEIRPRVERRDDGRAYAFELEVMPSFEIPPAESFQVSRGETAVGEQEITDFIGHLCGSQGAMSPLTAEETIVEDDAVVLRGTVAVEGATVRTLEDFRHLVGGYPLFGKPPREVVALFAGHRVGDALVFETVLPDNFVPAEHAGKPARVSVTISGGERLRRLGIPELLTRLGLPDEAALRQHVRERLAERKAHELRLRQLEELDRALLERIAIELPPKTTAKAIADAEARAAAQAQREQRDPEVAKAEVRADVERSLKRHCIRLTLARQLGVQVTDDDIRDQILLAAERTGRDPRAIAERLRDSGQLPQVVMEIREGKALEVFLDRVLAAQAGSAAT